jgi:hypothetical protein
MTRVALTAVLGVLVLVGACQKASEVAVEKRMPKLPPPPHAAPPPNLHIEVFIDGAPAPPIDADHLLSRSPDFQDTERRAYRLSTILGPPFARDHAVAEVTGEDDTTMLMRQAKDPTALEPVLMISRRGGVQVALVSAKDPFPQYHGEGRRLSRPGDPHPRIIGVKRIRVYLASDRPLQ